MTEPTTQNQAMQTAGVIVGAVLSFNALFFIGSYLYYLEKPVGDLALVRGSFAIMSIIIAAAAYGAALAPRVIGHGLALLISVASIVGGIAGFATGKPAVMNMTLMILGGMLPVLAWWSWCRSRAAWSFLIALVAVFGAVTFFGAPKDPQPARLRTLARADHSRPTDRVRDRARDGARRIQGLTTLRHLEQHRERGEPVLAHVVAGRHVREPGARVELGRRAQARRARAPARQRRRDPPHAPRARQIEPVEVRELRIAAIASRSPACASSRGSRRQEPREPRREIGGTHAPHQIRFDERGRQEVLAARAPTPPAHRRRRA